MTLISILAAIGVGFSLGLLGGGGSILTVPILVYLLDFPPKVAIPVSLFIVGLGALFGALRHHFKSNVQLKAAGAFVPAAMLGAWLGAKVSAFIAPTLQMVIFGVLTVLAAIAMLRPKDKKIKSASNIYILLSSAFGVGLLTGIVGVGGGFMIVPVLVYFANMSMIHAVGTSLLIIAFNSFAGFVGYLGMVEIPWSFSLIFAGVVIVGILLGIKASDHIDNTKLKQVFAGMLIVIGVFILFKNLF